MGGPALRALIAGAFGSWYAFGSGTLVRATPLMLTGLGVAIAFRAGVFNIGAEGQFLVGAAAGAAVAGGLSSALGTGQVGPGVTHVAPIATTIALLLVLSAGAVAGAAWAGIAATLRTRFHVLEVISTIMLNFVAANLVSYLVRGPMQEPTHIYPQSQMLATAARLPRLGPTGRLHAGFLIAVMACAIAWWTLRYTAAGFRLSATGANPYAARSAGGIDVVRTTTRAFLISGALAGLAGATEVSGTTFALYENISPGYGFTAIAVALLAQLHPLGVIVTGVLFGALEAGAAAMQRDASVPAVVASIIEAVLILGFVAAAWLRSGRRTR